MCICVCVFTFLFFVADENQDTRKEQLCLKLWNVAEDVILCPTLQYSGLQRRVLRISTEWREKQGLEAYGEEEREMGEVRYGLKEYSKGKRVTHVLGRQWTPQKATPKATRS